ncbi:uncharacterized protein LOC127081859 [Lathyrus oleraceus]|uniref:uncharacterized protein LOC127081859 n=1 Tax=Pisum sativum TaxID=3888 RepID=UPI0021D35A6C|nr:uncharacterized protein LOC127081859 [Pisum sativum]
MDINVICIFLIQNLVLTLLIDTYYFIHHRTEKNEGIVMCCAPLLYLWFISNLSQSSVFTDNKKRLRWSQRIMSLTNANVTWYSRVNDDMKIIDSCREFPNIPLLGTKGCINYNPILARSQLGYAMKDKPSNILLEGFLIQEVVDIKGLKEKIVRVWNKIHMKGNDKLGNRDCVALEPYTQWVQARVAKIKMPYPPEEPMFSKVIRLIPVPVEYLKGLQVALARLKQERDAWESKFHVSNAKKLELQRKFKEKDYMLHQKDGLIEQHGKKMNREQKARSGAWKDVIDKILKEKADMQIAFEAQIKKLKRKSQHGEGSSLVMVPSDSRP